jgi:hypothetical protein
MTKRGRGSSGALVVLVMRAPLVKRVGAIEVPPGTRARRTTSLFAPSVACVGWGVWARPDPRVRTTGRDLPRRTLLAGVVTD